MGFYSKTLHGEFNEHHNTLNGYMLSGDANSAATAAAITALNGRGDNDISPYSLNGYHLAGPFNETANTNGLFGRSDNDIGPYSLQGYHLSGRGDNDISPFSLNGNGGPVEGYSTATLAGIGIGGLALGMVAGYFFFRKK